MFSRYTHLIKILTKNRTKFNNFNVKKCHSDSEKFLVKLNRPTIEPNDSSKTLKYSLISLGITLFGASFYMLVKCGRAPLDSNGQEIQDEFSPLPIYEQYICRVLKEIEQFALFIQQPSRDKLLPDPIELQYQPPYTLILELTDVLVHPEWTYTTGWRFKKRPGLDYFLENLVGLYEIVIFTAEQGQLVFPLVEALDKNNLISYKLVRDSTHFINGHHVKNLNKLNRDLSKVVLVDWNEESVKFNTDNHLNIGKWDGNDDDCALYDLTSFLITIAQNDVEDVRDVLKYYKTFEDPLATFKVKQKEILEENAKIAGGTTENLKKNYFY